MPTEPHFFVPKNLISSPLRLWVSCRFSQQRWDGEVPCAANDYDRSEWQSYILLPQASVTLARVNALADLTFEVRAGGLTRGFTALRQASTWQPLGPRPGSLIFIPITVPLSARGSCRAPGLSCRIYPIWHHGDQGLASGGKLLSWGTVSRELLVFERSDLLVLAAMSLPQEAQSRVHQVRCLGYLHTHELGEMPLSCSFRPSRCKGFLKWVRMRPKCFFGQPVSFGLWIK
ncbi:hypothetical protein E4A48_01340 [Xanthomonas cerealis pv. cerealis]|uniref:Uncharacterized protein n=1 Tax=Xanthomonas cerealis pv. cerealis TaxID=152263 RepID=A0A514E9R5_9XANT|nr:hypothetical protein E4A48_01340 [Xanthomonas translucens pv. cerealis]